MVILNFKQNVKSVSDETVEECVNKIACLEFMCKLDMKNKLILLPNKKPKINNDYDYGLVNFTDKKSSKTEYKHDIIKKNKNSINKYDSYDDD